MPHVDGLHLLKFVKEVNPESIVIMITGYGTVNSAVEAMKLGAFDYITKPSRTISSNSPSTGPCPTRNSRKRTSR